jgi:hypothetical protein
MMRHVVRAAATLTVLALVVPVAPPALAAKGSIRCESKGNNYNYCRVDTENNVSLRRQLSNSPCQRNRSWGYDNNGIWVDRGCRADFDFGRSSGSSGNKDAAVAAGIIGAFALGAAIASSQNQPAQPPPPRPLPPLRPPGWAVGTFHAWDPDFHSTVILDVVGDGRVYLRDEGGRLINEGGFRDGMVYWNNGRRSWLAREGPGVMLGDVDSGKHYNFNRS